MARARTVMSLSDIYEQLGCIVLAAGRGGEAVSHLQRSLIMRPQLHKQQREASSLRHLAIAYLTLRHLDAEFRNQWQGTLIHQHLGAFNQQRIVTPFRK